MSQKIIIFVNKDDKESNDYLNNVFIPKMNKRFSYEINPDKDDIRENT